MYHQKSLLQSAYGNLNTLPLGARQLGQLPEGNTPCSSSWDPRGCVIQTPLKSQPDPAVPSPANTGALELLLPWAPVLPSLLPAGTLRGAWLLPWGWKCQHRSREVAAQCGSAVPRALQSSSELLSSPDPRGSFASEENPQAGSFS